MNSKKQKRIALLAWIKGAENESHWGHKWDELPFIGRYRRIKKFLKWYELSYVKDLTNM